MHPLFSDASISSGLPYNVFGGGFKLPLHVFHSGALHQYEYLPVCHLGGHFHDESHFGTDLPDEV